MPADQSLDSAARFFETSPEPAFVVDLGGSIVYWNRAAETFFGIPANEALGRPCAMVVRGLGTFGDIQCTRDCPLLARAARDDSYTVVDTRVPTGPRPVRWARTRMHHLPLEDDSGKTRYVLHLLTDTLGDQDGSRPSRR